MRHAAVQTWWGEVVTRPGGSAQLGWDLLGVAAVLGMQGTLSSRASTCTLGFLGVASSVLSDFTTKNHHSSHHITVQHHPCHQGAALHPGCRPWAAGSAGVAMHITCVLLGSLSAPLRAGEFCAGCVKADKSPVPPLDPAVSCGALLLRTWRASIESKFNAACSRESL